MDIDYKTKYFKRQNSKALLMNHDEISQKVPSNTKTEMKTESFEIEEIDQVKKTKIESIFENVQSFEYEKLNRALEIFRYVSIAIFTIPILVRQNYLNFN